MANYQDWEMLRMQEMIRDTPSHFSYGAMLDLKKVLLAAIEYRAEQLDATLKVDVEDYE